MDSNTNSTKEEPGAPHSTTSIQAEATRPILEVSDKVALSVTLIAAIILFFEEKTPVAVVVLLTIGFACGLYILIHLVGILPWVQKAKSRASWSFVSSMIVASMIWATLVGCYGVKKWPKREIIVAVSFKDSPLFTPKRKKRIEIELDDYYRYLRNLGFDLPKEIPPLGVSRPHSVMLGGGSQGPSYYSSLVISEDVIDVPGALWAIYSSYTFDRILVWPNAWNPKISPTETENDEVAALIYSCYYPASFSGQSVCDKSMPGHKWG